MIARELLYTNIVLIFFGKFKIVSKKHDGQEEIEKTGDFSTYSYLKYSGDRIDFPEFGYEVIRR